MILIKLKEMVILFNMFCQLCSVFVPIGMMYFLLFPLFLVAFLSGTYQSVLNINLYNEGDIEIMIWAVTIPFMIWGGYLNIKFIKKYLGDFYAI